MASQPWIAKQMLHSDLSRPSLAKNSRARVFYRARRQHLTRSRWSSLVLMTILTPFFLLCLLFGLPILGVFHALALFCQTSLEAKIITFGKGNSSKASGKRRAEDETPDAPSFKKGKKAGGYEDYAAVLDRYKAKDAKGKDNPFNKQENSRQRCTILLNDGNNGLIMVLDTKLKLDPDSQNAKLIISKQCGMDDAAPDYTISIGSEHISIVDNSVENTFSRQYIEKEDVNHTSIREALYSMRMNTPTAEQLTYLIGDGTCIHGGFSGLAFAGQGGLNVPVDIHSPQGEQIDRSDPFNHVITALRTGSRIAIIRGNFQRQRLVGDQFWLHRMKPICEKGIYPAFEPLKTSTVVVDDEMIEETYLQQYLHGRRRLPTLEWMKKKKNDDGAEDEYGHFAPKSSFTSLKEYQIVFSLAQIHEVQYIRDINDAIFNFETRHHASAERIDDDTWHMTIALTLPDDASSPKILEGSTVQLQMRRSNTIDEAEDEIDETRVFTMKKIESESVSRGAFVLEWRVDHNLPNPWATTPQADATLKIDYNLEPAKRCLKALEDIADLQPSALTQFILGRNYDKYKAKFPSLVSKAIELGDEVRNSLVKLIDRMTLNYFQWMAFDLPLFNQDEVLEVQKDGRSALSNYDASVSLLRGPPGTGKSLVIASQAIVAVILRCFVVVCAPSKTARDAVALKIVEILKLADTVFPNGSHGISMTVWPSQSDSQCLAKEYLRQKPHTTAYSNSDQDVLRLYQWYTRAIQQLADIYTNKLDGYEKLEEWYNTLKRMMDNDADSMKDQKLSDSEWNSWWKQLVNFETVIDKKTNLLISTCNNLARVKDIPNIVRSIQQEGLVIIDEAGFDQEYDIAIPVSLNARQLSLVGDQAQLAPIISSAKVNVFAAQGKLSIFQRTVEWIDVQLVTLKRTYRMHKRLAELLGVISYGGLIGRDDMDAVYYDWNTWFTSSKFLRLRRLPPDMSYFKDAGRVFLNLHSRSAQSQFSMSTVNFANINIICNIVKDFLTTHPSRAGSITVVVPFAAQRDEIIEQFDLRDIKGVKVKTVDSFQGGENDIIILCLTCANTNDGSALGFMPIWNRINVAISRPKQALILVGNMDLWRTRISKINNDFGEFSKLLMDIIHKGDIYDIAEDDTIHKLPRNRQEVLSGNWSRDVGNSQPKKAPKDVEPLRAQRLTAEFGTPVDAFTTKEKKIFDSLAAMRQTAKENIKRVMADEEQANKNKFTTRVKGLLTRLPDDSEDDLEDHSEDKRDIVMRNSRPIAPLPPTPRQYSS